jgi:hypothetical protein
MRAACSSSTQKTMVFWKRSPLSFRNPVIFFAAHRAEGRDLEHIRIVEIEHAFVLIFGEERIEHGAGLRPVFCEHVALFHVVGPLAAGQRLAVKGDMADQVEGIKVLAKFFGAEAETATLREQLKAILAEALER